MSTSQLHFAESQHRPGQILQVLLPNRTLPGHEQRDLWPYILIADPSAVQPLLYPMLLVAPIISKRLSPITLYPRLEAGAGRLPIASTVLLDQLMAIDAHRVRGYIGALSQEEFAPIQAGLKRMFGFEEG